MGEQTLLDADVTLHPLSGPKHDVRLFWHEERLYRAASQELYPEHFAAHEAPIQPLERTRLRAELAGVHYPLVYRQKTYSHSVRLPEAPPALAREILVTICRVALAAMGAGRSLYDVHEGNVALTTDGVLWLDWGAFDQLWHAWDGFAFTCALAHEYLYVPTGHDIAPALRRNRGPTGSAHTYLAGLRDSDSPLAPLGHEEPTTPQAWHRLLARLQEAPAPAPPASAWLSYPCATDLDHPEQLSPKAGAVARLLRGCDVDTITDLGCNKGYYSLLAAQQARSVVGLDLDAACVQAALDWGRRLDAPAIFGVKDLTQLAGYPGHEQHRFASELVMALALTHHLPEDFSPAAFAQALCPLAQRYFLLEDIDGPGPWAAEILAQGFHLAERVDSSPAGRTLSLYERSQLG